MEEKNKNINAREMVIGGGLLLGMGVGFFFFQISVFYFTGCMFGGLGLGLILSNFVPEKKDK